MNELISIKKQLISNNEVNAVNARELHVFLESKQQFVNWIKNRIDQYGFTEGVDFVKSKRSIKTEKTYINTIEYSISIDMAKALCVAEANEKGKQILKEIASKSIVTLQEMMDFAKNIDIDEPDMFVYAMMEEDTGNIKIGISKDPERRLKQLQTGNSSRLILVATHKAENRFNDERSLHHKNENYNIHGEWFSNEAKNTLAI